MSWQKDGLKLRKQVTEKLGKAATGEEDFEGTILGVELVVQMSIATQLMRIAEALENMRWGMRG